MGLLSGKRTPRPERDDNGDRKHDGLGLTLDAAGKAFFRQRESGYKGWIDQDGKRVDGQGKRLGGDV
jgi:hypothetical protein